MEDPVPEEALLAGRGYEALFVPALFQPWALRVAAAAGLAAGDRVLDVACGTGVLAREARRRVGEAGRVAGLDPAPGMIAAAREIEPGIDWIPGSAEDLPFDDDSFDAVLSQFGIMFFEDRAAAAREMARVTRPGGRLVLAAWHGTDRNPIYRDIAALLDTEVSPAAGDAVRVPFRLGNPEDLAGLLRAAGCVEIAVETATERARFPDTRTMVEAELRGWLPLFGIHLDEERIAALLARFEAALASHAAPEREMVFPAAGYIVSARAPGRAG
jgi:ubiquinone/menaquinone biosynthesis C-methylase UbiE